MKALKDKYAEDVRLIKQVARFWIFINSNGEIQAFGENKNRKLNVIAVIGIDPIFGEVLLFELGIGATRPYHNARFKAEWIHQRRKDFFLSRIQYLAIRPFLFNLIRMLAKETISGWKSPVRAILVGKTMYRENGIFNYKTKKRKTIDVFEEWIDLQRSKILNLEERHFFYWGLIQP